MVYREGEDSDGTRHYVGRNVIGGGRTVRYSLTRAQRRRGNLVVFITLYPALALLGVVTWVGYRDDGMIGAVIGGFLASGALGLVGSAVAVITAVRSAHHDRSSRRRG